VIIRVVNAKRDMSAIRRGEYVGRGNWQTGFKRSPLANPFKIGRDGSRGQVIDCVTPGCGEDCCSTCSRKLWDCVCTDGADDEC